jgi:hypothetical protein
VKDHLGNEVVLALIENTAFAAGSVVELDGKHFRHCSFGNGCLIEFTGAPYMFEQCSFGTPIQFRFGGPAATVLCLIQMLCDNFPEVRSELVPNWKTWKEYDEKTIVQ